MTIVNGTNHFHLPEKPEQPRTDRCPLCGHSITRAEFLRLQNKIRMEERKKLNEQRELVTREAAKRIAIAAARNELKVKQLMAQRDDALRKARQTEANRGAHLKKLEQAIEERHKREQARLRETLLK